MAVLRRQVLLAYEIPKWDGDLGVPNLYVPLDEEVVDRKVRLLGECFTSQSDKPWFFERVFRGMLAVRGVEAGTAWAERFTPRSWCGADGRRLRP